jgi:hypothetical protein
LTSGSIEDRHAKFWILGGGEDEQTGLPSTLHGIAVRVLHRADMIAAEMRIKNWSQILRVLPVTMLDAGALSLY